MTVREKIPANLTGAVNCYVNLNGYASSFSRLKEFPFRGMSHCSSFIFHNCICS